MFKKITLFFALGLVLLGFNVNSQTTRFIVNPASNTLEIGDTLVVAVTSQDFTDVIAFTYSMNWDPNVLQFVEGDDDIVPVNIPPALFFGTNMANIGNLTFGWNDPFLNPMSVDNDLVLYEIVRFTAIAAGTSPINLSGMPAAANIVTINSDETPLFTNASVVVTDPNAPTNPPFECMFNNFGLAIEADSAATGEQLCLDVNLCNGDSLVSFQYSLNFNPAILQFDSFTNINLPQPDNFFFNSNNTDGWVTNFWLDSLNMGVDVPDTLIYEACFTVVGAGGEMDTVRIGNTPLAIDVTKSSNPGINIGMETQDGPIVVSGNSSSAITLVAANVEGSPGDTVCVAVTAQNFDAVTSFQYTFNFDDENLTYLNHQNFNPNIPNLSAAINDSPMFSDTGTILVVYPNPGGMSSTLMDGDTLYEVCFVIAPMAPVGANALVGFSDDPVVRSASQMAPASLLTNDGNVNVIPEEGSGDFELTIGTTTFCPDSSICVPVTVDDGFTNVSGGGFRVNFLPADLTYTGLENVNPAFAAGQVNWLDNNPTGTDRIILIMNNLNPTQAGINLVPGEIIFELCFTANGSADVTSPIILSPDNTPEFVDPTFDPITPIIINDGAAIIETAACPAGEVDITVTETIVNVLCNGDATGSISLEIGGGDGTNYAITWTGSPTDVSGLTTPTISNLEAGSYTVSITSGMRDFTDTYIITEPTPLTATTTSTNVICNGDGNGTITVTPDGGTMPYTYLWSNGPTDQNLSNLGPGTYTLTITDGNMCELILPPVTITEPPVLTVTIADTDNVSCLNGDDGAVSTTVAGGNGGYMYAWDGTNQVTGDIDNLTAGNYRVTVTDMLGCTAVSPVVTITQPSTAVGITIDNIIPANCNGGGSIFITPTGGDNMYTYVWNGPPGTTTQDNENIAAGGYIVTVTDGSGCVFTSEIIQVSSTPAITINEIITPPNCDSEADGAINLTISGGTGDGFTFNWDTDPAETTEDISNLLAGDYEVTVTDTGDGCTATAMYQLTNSINLTISEVSSTPAGCAGATNGSLTVQVNGGGGNYSYNWSSVPPQNAAVLSNVAAGTYTVTVTDDDSGCTEEESFTVDSDAGIVITGTETDASCSGAANGSIDITVTGAGNNPTFLWSDNTTQTEDIANIPDGNYVVTVTSTDGQCTQTAAFTVDAGDGFEIELDGIAQATCDGAENGTVNITVNGASGTPSFSWSNGETTEDINNAEGGTTVGVTVTDAAGCVEIGSYPVPSGNGFDINLVSIDNASCGGAADGAIDIELDGAQLPLTSIEWNTTPPTPTEDLSGVTSGTYTVFVTDAEGCNAMATYTVDNDGGISGAVQNVTDVTCNGSMDGSIALDVLNASDPSNLTFNWSSIDASGQNPIGLSADTYSVTITDTASGCTDVITDIIIGEPDPITFSSAVENVSCNGENDGMITITAMGGNGGFTYEWSHDNMISGNVASGLSPSSYIVTITDLQGCDVVTEGIVVTEPTAIAVTGDVTNVSGAGNDGAITGMATGGSGTYTNYDWIGPNGPLMGQTITGLIPGAYDLTVTDDDGCTGTGTFTVNAADAPIPSLVVVTDVTCFEGNDGSITIDVTGGSGGYTFNWQVPPGGPVIGNTVQNPTGLIAGTYNVTVTDDNNVSGILSSIVVGQPVELDYDLMDLISVSCPGFMDGEINISPIGGNGEPYTVDWGITPTPVDQFNPVGLAAGTYTPTITDAAGCTVEGRDVTVQEPEEIIITLVEIVDPSCDNGGDSGTIDIDVTGGTVGPGYTYNWELNGSTPPTFPSTPELTNLGPGSYTVTVTDDNGCTETGGPFVLDGLNAIIIQLDSVRHVRCAGIAEGAIFITTSGGSGDLMYQWKNGQGTVINTGSDIVGLIGGNYTVCVTDATGCSETLGPITVNEPQPITYDDIEIENASASADDGEIRLIGVDGGTPAYTFNWEGPNNAMQTTTVPTITDIPPGEWRVTIVDDNGCTEVITDIIIMGSLNVQATITDPTCNGDDDGSIELIVNGGTPQFEYEWSEFDGGCCIVQSAPNQFNLTAGGYSVTVTDDNGVIVIDTFELEDPNPIIVDFTVTNQTGSDCNGSINSTVTGGTQPYTYTWNNGATNSDPFDLCKGEYEVTVVDDNGCVAIPPSVFVTAGPLTWASFTPGGAACAGGTGGFLDAEVFGGCGPYTFTLTGPTPLIMTSNDGFANFTGLAAGVHEITVTDAAGSTALVNSFEITETLITIVADTIINNTGMGMCNGAVNITVSGGQLPYTYTWSNGATSQDVSDVCENQSPLSVVVIDANGCIFESEQFILIAGLSVALEINNESCAGDADGSIISTTVGGNAPYTYEWSNGETTPNLTGLTPGSYTVTVTDSQGRTVTESGTINGSSDPISVTSDVTTPTGANADGAIDLTVTGGTPPYDYEWSNGMFTSDIAGLTSGSYTVIITDFFGCVYSETFNLAGEAISLTFTPSNTGCPGQAGDLGTLEVMASGGTAPYSYLWDVTGQNNTGDVIGGLAPGNYSVTVTDASGLTAVGTGTVDELEEITIDLVVDEVNSNIVSTVTGGTAPYSYRWNDADFSTTTDLMDVPSGTYTLVISDANNCVNQATVELLAGPCEKVRKVISPNNDGFNDEFIVSCANRFDIELEIYNRWGQLEFMTANYSNNWVGTDMEGAKLPEGGYFYVIRYQDSEGQTQQIKGSLNIVY